MLIGRVTLESLFLLTVFSQWVPIPGEMFLPLSLSFPITFSALAHIRAPSIERCRGGCERARPHSHLSVWTHLRVFPASSSASVVSPQIRVPAFLDLFMQSLFKPGARINQDHKHKYIHILAYAASVVETWKKVPPFPGTQGLLGSYVTSSLCS